MTVLAPIYRKIRFSKATLIERRLSPNTEIVVKKGDTVVPFTKIAHAKQSKEVLRLDEKFKPTKPVVPTNFFYKGDKLGTVRFHRVYAPSNGYLTKKDTTYFFNHEKKDVWTLSGVWGSVADIIPDKSIVIQTNLVDINFIAFTPNTVLGELIVFPNPSELLDMEYLKNFSNNIKDKIVYVGHHIRRDIVSAAIDLGVGCLIGGSIDREFFEIAKKAGLSVAVTTGFGKLTTPPYVFEFMKAVSNRHVLVDGNTGMLRVPVPPEYIFNAAKQKETIRQVKEGAYVLIFDKKNFAESGFVERVHEDNVYVKLSRSDELAVVQAPNIFILV